MKVLMFGWEFPPHISGGLGTACYGLTKFLIEQSVEVLFVVPTMFGNDHPDFLVSADRVIRKREIKRRRLLERAVAAAKDRTGRSERQASGDGIRSIKVPFAMSPYDLYDSSAVSLEPGVRTWNYPLSSNRAFAQTAPEMLGIVEVPQEMEGEQFAFSGTYGKHLMEEVKRYAEVAGVIAVQNTFDVIHVHDWMTFPAGIVAKRKTKKPLVVHVHSTECDRAGAQVSREVFEIEQQGFKAADKIIAVSNWTKKIIVSRYHISADKVQVVHNGILPKTKDNGFSFPEIGSHFVTFLGRVTHQKGPWYFVEAAQKVLKHFPHAHFIVAGAGDLLPQIIERVAQLNMGACFHFTGFLTGDHVDQIWSITDVYVMPSVSEPFGIAPLEAIQGDVPVIISKQSGVAEVMPHAIKIDFWNTTALAAAICSVLRYESLSAVLRQNSKQYIENLTWEKAARDVNEVYHELSGKE
jgi:glycogen synthase